MFPGGFRSHLDADASVGVNQRPEPLRRAGDAHVRSGVEVSDTRAGRSEAEGLAAAKLCDDLRYFAVQGNSSLLVLRAPGGWEHHEPHEEAHPVADNGGDPDVR